MTRKGGKEKEGSFQQGLSAVLNLWRSGTSSHKKCDPEGTPNELKIITVRYRLRQSQYLDIGNFE